MSSAPGLRFTYQDYLELPDEQRYEIIDGDLFMSPAPTTSHQRIVRNLLFLLHQHVQERGLGEILPAPCDVVLSETDIVQPDILFVRRERAQIVGENYVSAAPDLVVEVLSKGSAMRDRMLKASLYSRAGVGEMWIVDPAQKTVEILKNSENVLARHSLFAATDTLLTPTFPGLEIPLAKVF